MKVNDWIESLRIPEDYPQITIGWPDAERGLSESYWQDYCDALAEDAAEEGIPYLPLTYEEWREREIAERGEEDEYTEFSWQNCDLCGARAGSRHHATAFHKDFQAHEDYIALEVCGDCICFFANGDVPDWLVGEND